MNSLTPVPGVQVEAYGVLATFITADTHPSGEVYFTVLASPSNCRLIGSNGHTEVISERLVVVPSSACRWRRAASMHLDRDERRPMAGSPAAQVHFDVHRFQLMLSRRDIALARAR